MKAKVIAKVLFATTLVSEFTAAIGLGISLVSRDMRIWPPPGKQSWQQYYILIPTFTAMASAVPLGIFDWSTFVVDHWSRFLVGGAAAVAGLSFALWGTRSLSLHTSLGLKGKLVTAGAYRCSRNPQYVGYTAAFLGYALFCNSVMTLMAATVGGLLFLVAPFTEEPWLRERFGPSYDEYAEEVPRFLGACPTLTRIRSRGAA